MTMGQAAQPDTLLSLKGVSKKFCRGLKRSLFYAAHDVSSDVFRGRRASDRLRKGEFWALDDISFELKRGQALGLVGPNGSGKTTLLRMIAGLIKPDAGSIEVRGRLAPLIALGAGFSPVLTGRENILVNLSILGLSRAEIKAVFEEVVDFAEIEEAIDAPLRTYSSGMTARLGFACAMQVKPDILLIDEVLAVGDMRFRLKCYRHLNELRNNGTATILVSHNPISLLANCKSGILIERGREITQGTIQSICDRYATRLFGPTDSAPPNALALNREQSLSDGRLRILRLFFRNANLEPAGAIMTGEACYFCMTMTATEQLSGVSVNILVRNSLYDNQWTQSFSSVDDGARFDLDRGSSEIRIHFPYFGFAGGQYSMKLNLKNKDSEILDVVESFSFAVTDAKGVRSRSFYQPVNWHLGLSDDL